MREKIRHLLLLSIFCVYPAYAAEEAGGGKGEFLSWKYQMTAEDRLRYEYKQDFDFNGSRKDNGTLMFNRYRIGAKAALSDEYLNDLAEVFVEGMGAQAGGYKIAATTSQRDELDLHQAYVNVFNIAGSAFSVKVGRQELKYGAGRLVAAPTWANLIRTFDAAVLRYEKNGFYGDALYARNVKFTRYSFDDSYPSEILDGVYLGYQKHNMAPLLEGYYFNQVNTQLKNDIHRYTAGLRFKSTVAPGTVVDIEVPYQFGHDAGKDVRAYALHADVSRSFESAAWKPKLGFSYDYASGDKKSADSVNNTFIPLYQSTHDPYGLMDFFRWENMHNPEFSVILSPTDKFRFRPQVDFFWLDSKNDSWYNSSGTVLRTRPARGKCSSYVGSEASVRFYYDFGKNIKFESGYAHFFPGDYVRNSGSAGSADWAYSQLTVKY